MEENGHAAHLKKLSSGIKAKLFQRKNALALAHWLLGKHLALRWPDGREEARLITETEAKLWRFVLAPRPDQTDGRSD